MNIRKEEDGTYSVESTSKKDKWYNVDVEKPWCDCPAFKFRYMKSKSPCKHLAAVREHLEKAKQKTLTAEMKKADSVVEWVEKQGGEVDSISLINKYGEEEVNRLITMGELLERKGRITILK